METAGLAVVVGLSGAVVGEGTVVVVTGAGMVTPVARGSVVATGPTGIVVGGENGPVNGRKRPPADAVVEVDVLEPIPSPLTTPSASTSGVGSAETRSRNQPVPAITARTMAPAVIRTVAAEMRRPTTTLPRREKRRFDGAVWARRCAICLARSSGLWFGPRLGWGN